MEENELQQVLDNILEDKTTNLKPENLKQGVTCLGIEGSLDSEGVTQLSIHKEDILETPEGVTYPFTLNSDGYYESTNKGQPRSFSYCKMWFWSDGTTPLTVQCINSGESNLDYGLLSNIDTDLQLNNSGDSSAFKSFKGQSSLDAQIVTYDIVPIGLHYITVKFIKDGSSNSGNDSLQIKSDQFHTIDETLSVYAVSSKDQMSSVTANIGDLLLVGDNENRVYQLTNNEWICVTNLNNSMKVFSSIEEMNSIEGSLNQNAIVYGTGFGPFKTPSSSMKTTIALKQSFSIQPWYEGGGMYAEASFMDDNGIDHRICKYGDQQYEYTSIQVNEGEIVYYTVQDYTPTEVSRWHSEDGINYTTSDFTDKLIIENVTISSYTFSGKTEMIYSQTPSFYGIFTYKSDKDPKSYQGYTDFTYENEEISTNKDLEEVITLAGPKMVELLETTGNVSSLIVQSSDTIYDFYYCKMFYPDGGNYTQGTPRLYVPNDSSNVKIIVCTNNVPGTLGPDSYDNTNFYHVKVNLSDKSVTGEVLQKIGDITLNSGGKIPYVAEVSTQSWITIASVSNNPTFSISRPNSSLYKHYDLSDWSNYQTYVCSVPNITKWWYADTQFSELQKSDVYNGICAYGSNGVNTGDNSWQNNITNTMKLLNYFGKDNVKVWQDNALYNKDLDKQYLLSSIDKTLNGIKYIKIDDTITEGHYAIAKSKYSGKGVYQTPNIKYKLKAEEDRSNKQYKITVLNQDNDELFSKTYTVYSTSESDIIGLAKNYGYFKIYTGNGIYTIAKIYYESQQVHTCTINIGEQIWSFSDESWCIDTKHNVFYWSVSNNDNDTSNYRITESDNALSYTKLFSTSLTNGAEPAILLDYKNDKILIINSYDNYKGFEYGYRIIDATNGRILESKSQGVHDADAIHTTWGDNYGNSICEIDDTYIYYGNEVFDRSLNQVDDVEGRNLSSQLPFDLEYKVSITPNGIILLNLQNNESITLAGDLSSTYTVMLEDNKLTLDSIGSSFVDMTDSVLYLKTDGSNSLLTEIRTYSDSDTDFNAICIPSAVYRNNYDQSTPTISKQCMVIEFPKQTYENTISPTEYNTAINTTERILGKE